jgi:hypothetical protein
VDGGLAYQPGGGPFVGDSEAVTLFAAACYLAAVAVTGLALAAAVSHERACGRPRRPSCAMEEMRAALDAARMGTWSWTSTERPGGVGPTMGELFHLAAGRDGRLLRRVSWPGCIPRTGLRRDDHRAGEWNGAPASISSSASRWPMAGSAGSPTGDGFGSATDGRVIGLTGVTSDVTDRRVTEQQLRQAHRMESIGRLAGGGSPTKPTTSMSVIIGASDFIRRHPALPLDVKTDVDHIRRAAERTATVTAHCSPSAGVRCSNPLCWI